MRDIFEIRSINNTFGDIYVNAPLDREAVDRYLLKVRADLLRDPQHTLLVTVPDVHTDEENDGRHFI